jgi:hypothetical protein
LQKIQQTKSFRPNKVKLSFDLVRLIKDSHGRITADIEPEDFEFGSRDQHLALDIDDCLQDADEADANALDSDLELTAEAESLGIDKDETDCTLFIIQCGTIHIPFFKIQCILCRCIRSFQVKSKCVCSSPLQMDIGWS